MSRRMLRTDSQETLMLTSSTALYLFTFISFQHQKIIIPKPSHSNIPSSVSRLNLIRGIQLLSKIRFQKKWEKLIFLEMEKIHFPARSIELNNEQPTGFFIYSISSCIIYYDVCIWIINCGKKDEKKIPFILFK